jgi:signal transduction histidine kinase
MRDEEKTKDQLLGELQQSREEFKKFTYIVSHDLRTPLINLKGFSAEMRFAVETVQTAIEPILSQLDETQRSAVITAIERDIPESLEFIESSVSRIDAFMNAVLRLSRLSRRELKLEPIDMDVLVQSAIDSLSDEIKQYQAKVSVKSPLPETVADRASMLEVVEAILKNAVAYQAAGRPGEIEVAGERGPDEIVFTVRDNGRGIAEGDMYKVFEPFRRAGKQDIPGEGMGLIYAQTLIRLHGGRVTCESELGEGTMVTFTVSNHLAEGGGYA